ncbi:MAG: DUF2306 domain-containing protein [Maricaulaceae bacterium]
MAIEAFFEAPRIIQAHALAAGAAVLLGGVQVAGPKLGRRVHRLLGWSWVAIMAFVVLTAVLMRPVMLGELKGWAFQPVMVFIPLTAWGLWGGLRHIRSGRIKRHARTMRQLYAGALIVAGVFAFLPSRLMGKVVFGG